MASLIQKRWFWPAVIILLTFVGLLVHPEAIARPGGGSSYSGGGSFGGGGGGGGGGDGGGAILYLIIRYPHIGIPLLILFIIFRVYMSRNQPDEFIASTGHGGPDLSRTRSVNQQLELYKAEDQNFSQTLFLDFSQHLYYQFHHWRSKKEFLQLRPYFDPTLLEREHHRHEKSEVNVSELVIGTIDIFSFHQNEEYDFLIVHIDANYTETRKGHSNRFIVHERWTFKRKRGVLSKGPEEMGGLCCPNCGSGLELSPTGECKHCGTVVEPGAQHWEVIGIAVPKRQVEPAHQFGHYAQERGTNLTTVVDPGMSEDLRKFASKHGISDFADYWVPLKENVIEPVFRKVYEAWEEQDWEKARPLMTDFLFMSQKYWMDAYRKAEVRNKLDDLKIHRIDLAKVDLDKYYETFTVRIFASVKDYMVNSGGKVFAGNASTPRKFSEYWTFIRRAGVEKPPTEYKPDACPNCGAPVKMGQTGICEYCNSKVSTGEFNWVLSRITQDEAYSG